MPLPIQPITWARARVQNFTEEYAAKFVHALVTLDGAAFDKVRFFEVLVEQGVVGTPAIPAGETRESIYAKRWDSYLAPIRPFGLGFVVKEQRQQSPSDAQQIWRVSDIARRLDRREIGYRDFMRLQLARTQFPKVTMPLADPAKSQLQAGAEISPLRLFVEAMETLGFAGSAMHLTKSEIRQLPRCQTHSDVAALGMEIIDHRDGAPTPNWFGTDPPDVDILVNDLVATGYFRRLPTTADDTPYLFPSFPRWASAWALIAAVGTVDVPNDVEAYFERLMGAPSDEVLAALGQPPLTLRVSDVEAAITGPQLSGPPHVVAGLLKGDEVFHQTTKRLLRVAAPSVAVTLTGGDWTTTASVNVVAYQS